MTIRMTVMTTGDFGRCRVNDIRKLSSPVSVVIPRITFGFTAEQNGDHLGTFYIYNPILDYIPWRTACPSEISGNLKSHFSLLFCYLLYVYLIFLESVLFRGRFGDHYGLLCFYPVSLQVFCKRFSNNRMGMRSSCASSESAMVGALGQIIAQGRPDADWEAQTEANTLCKIIWDALAVCIFLWKRVRRAWLVWQERELLISRHIYLSYKKLKKSFAIFSEYKTFRCIWLCRPSCSLGIYKKFLVTLLFQSLVLTVKNAWLRTLIIRYGRYITQQRL